MLSEIVSMNRKAKVKLKRLMEVKKYYLSLYRCYMMMLYDKGYIDDPTVLNKNKLLKLLVEMNVNDLYTYSGKIELNSDHCLYAMAKNRDNDEIFEMLSLFFKVFKYREYCKTIDNIFEEYSFRERDINLVKTLMVAKGARVVQRSGIPFNTAVGRCISEFMTETKSIDINECIWCLALKTLGVPEEDWYKDGIFDEELSHKDEVENAKGILNGFYVVSGGKYLPLLKEWLFKHRWNYESKFKMELLGLYDYVFSSDVSEISKHIDTKLEGLKEYDILAIQDAKIYYNVPRNTFDMPFGCFSVVCSGYGEVLSDEKENIYGYTGEAYSEDYLIDEDIDFVGCPIEVQGRICYDLEQTNITYDTWFKSEGANFEFVGNADGKYCNEVYKKYKESQCDANKLVATIEIKDESDFSKTIKEAQRCIITGG